jgi:hypothetical protein
MHELDFVPCPLHNHSMLSYQPMTQPDAWRIIHRRAAAAGIVAPIGCHTFRAKGAPCGRPLCST